jgi:DNA invertase Pin-like site-specific DNA recombinase
MNNPRAAKSQPRAVIYIRVSSDRPSTEYALDAQRVKFQRIAEKLGWTAIDVYTEPGQATTGKSVS